MSVLVRNESGNPWVFERSGGKRQIAAGTTALISDEEWQSIITAKRGPGKLNPIGTDPSTRTKVNFDYLLVGSVYEILYAGYADQTALDNDPVWVVKKFTYATLGTENKVTQVQVLDGATWTGRAGLPWT